MAYLGNSPEKDYAINTVEYTATEGQTTFAVTYGVSVDVYVNGLLLSRSAYTATDGVQVILNTGLIAGDLVSLHGYTSIVDVNSYTKAETDALISGIVTDHGELTGLADDDHPQYHNDTRGDARYYTKTEIDTNKQDKLISGTNIATVGGVNLLLGGDVSLGNPDPITDLTYAHMYEFMPHTNDSLTGSSLDNVIVGNYMYSTYKHSATIGVKKVNLSTKNVERYTATSWPLGNSFSGSFIYDEGDGILVIHFGSSKTVGFQRFNYDLTPKTANMYFPLAYNGGLFEVEGYVQKPIFSDGYWWFAVTSGSTKAYNIFKVSADFTTSSYKQFYYPSVDTQGAYSSFVVDATYIWVFVATIANGKLYKINKSTFTIIASQYFNSTRGIIWDDATHIILKHSTANRMFKILKSDMSIVAYYDLTSITSFSQTGGYVNNIDRLIFTNGNFLYFSSGGFSREAPVFRIDFANSIVRKKAVIVKSYFTPARGSSGLLTNNAYLVAHTTSTSTILNIFNLLDDTVSRFSDNGLITSEYISDVALPTTTFSVDQTANSFAVSESTTTPDSIANNFTLYSLFGDAGTTLMTYYKKVQAYIDQI